MSAGNDPTNSSEADDVALQREVRWRTGPRTRAWDELWCRLLEGLLMTASEDGSTVADGADRSNGSQGSREA